MDGTQDANGRVTLAEVKRDLQYLISMVTDTRSDVRRVEANNQSIEERLIRLEVKMEDFDRLRGWAIGGMLALCALLLTAVVVLVRTVLLIVPNVVP